MGELDGKVAIVTGAGRMRGIGRACAVELAHQGADVVVTGTGRSPERYPPDEQLAGWQDIESTAKQVRGAGRRCLPLVADVTNGQDARRTVAEAVRQFGRVDLLINNAAYARGPDRVPVVDLDEAVFRRVLEIKVIGSFLMARAVAPVLISQGAGGEIVNISSIAGKRGSANTAAYAASNFGVQGFTQSLAQELARHNIRVNAVCPGATDTSRMDDIGRGERWEALASSIPLRRVASDEEIAGVCAWLCGERASYITGQSINVDGGLVMW